MRACAYVAYAAETVADYPASTEWPGAYASAAVACAAFAAAAVYPKSSSLFGKIIRLWIPWVLIETAIINNENTNREAR